MTTSGASTSSNAPTSAPWHAARNRLTTSAQGFPISYAVRGRQYVAIPVGVGAASWGTGIPIALTPEIIRPSGEGNAIFVFALPEKPGT